MVCQTTLTQDHFRKANQRLAVLISHILTVYDNTQHFKLNDEQDTTPNANGLPNYADTKSLPQDPSAVGSLDLFTSLQSVMAHNILDFNMTQNSFIFESTQHFNNIMLQGSSLEAFLFFF